MCAIERLREALLAPLNTRGARYAAEHPASEVLEPESDPRRLNPRGARKVREDGEMRAYTLTPRK